MGCSGGRDSGLEMFGRTDTDMSDIMNASGTSLGRPFASKVMFPDMYSTLGNGNDRSY